jgi:hypothetical protein
MYDYYTSDNNLVTPAQFELAANDSLLVNAYRPGSVSGQSKFAYTGKVVPFRTADGRYGLLRVIRADETPAGGDGDSCQDPEIDSSPGEMKIAVKIRKQNTLKPLIVKPFRFIISAILLLAAAAGVSAQGTITGRVTGAPEGRPLPNAAVILDGVRGVTTGNDGRFLIDRVPAGTHSVEARILGYIAVTETVTVKDGGTVTVDFRGSARTLLTRAP